MIAIERWKERKREGERERERKWEKEWVIWCTAFYEQRRSMSQSILYKRFSLHTLTKIIQRLPRDWNREAVWQQRTSTPQFTSRRERIVCVHLDRTRWLFLSRGKCSRRRLCNTGVDSIHSEVTKLEVVWLHHHSNNI